MKTITPFDPNTGRFGAVLQVPDAAAERYKPFKEGRFDKRTQRVDLATNSVVTYQRHASEIDAEQRAVRARLARRRIQQLEISQARRVRELLAENDPTLKAIDDEIAALRADL